MTISSASGSERGLETLATLPAGVSATLLSPHITSGSGHRLMEMGLTEGTTITVMRRAPLGGPLEVHVRGTRITMRETDAEGFGVTRDVERDVVAGERTVVLIGNPNSGKTTLFNRITGLDARTGNYPGITVEHREANVVIGGRSVNLIDLPGTYSLVPRAEDEALTVRVLLGLVPDIAPPDLVVVVLDGSHLERNLFLLLQLVELHCPVVVAVTMLDVIEADRRTFDLLKLQDVVGVPVVSSDHIEAALKDSLTQIDANTFALAPLPATNSAVDDESSAPGSTSESASEQTSRFRRLQDERTFAEICLQRDVQNFFCAPGSNALPDFFSADETRKTTPDVVKGAGTNGGASSARTAARFRRAESLAEGVVKNRGLQIGSFKSEEMTTKIDAVVLHPRLGPIILVGVFALLFQALFSWAGPIMDAVSALVAGVGAATSGLFPSSLPLLKSLWMDGFVAGIGNVLVFVPQIFILFFALGLLEDSGYLARAAFLLDRLMAQVGLHGRAFVPMLSGFACAVPAVMAARTIENEKDRIVTILVTPLVSCSARLPVYSLVIATIFSTSPLVFGFLHVGTVLMFSMYALSIVAAIAMAALFKRTLLKSPTPELVMELPSYRAPSLPSLLKHSLGRVRLFLVEAGTIILALTIILWGLFNFPRDTASEEKAQAAITVLETQHKKSTERLADNKMNDDGSGINDDSEMMAALAKRISAQKAQLATNRVAYSLAGRMGRFIEPVVEPLGFDWKIGVGLVASFAAREVLVSSLGLVYGLGDGQDETSVDLRQAMRDDVNPKTGKKVYTPLTGLSLMVFFVLAMQCMSTLAAVKRETGGWKWPIFQFTYMTVLAYLSALLVFQIGRMLGFS